MALHLVPPIARYAKMEKGFIPLAVVRGGAHPGRLLCFHPDDQGGDSLLTLGDDETFELIPEIRDGMRSVYHIVGPSGSGKSTVSAGFARNFQRLWPDGKIAVVSSIEDFDPAFEGIDHVRLAADEELDAIEMPELAAASEGDPTLLIFDDVEGLPKARKRALENFQQRALETGRKLNIHVLNIFHRAAAGNSTKTSLSEANGVVMFPRANTGNLEYTLKRYFNINPSIKKLLKAPEWGRWVLVRTDGHPSYLLGEKRASLYDSDEVNDELRRAGIVERARACALAREEAKAATAAAAADQIWD